MSANNFHPCLVVYNSDLKTSCVLDSCFRPIVTARGRYPNCQWDSAVACPDDAPAVTAHADAIRIYFEGCTRQERQLRIRSLFEKCPALRDVMYARINATSQPRPPVVIRRKTEAERVFGETLTSNNIS
jgi:hypothetical protein